MKLGRAFFRVGAAWLVVAAIMAAVGRMCVAQPAGKVPAPAGATGQDAGPARKAVKMSMLELVRMGGYFMIPIGVCSLLGLAVIIERSIALRRGAVLPKGFMDGLKGVFKHDGEDRRAGLEYCNTRDCPISRVAAAGIRKLHRDEQSVEQAIEDAGANEVAKLRRHLRMLYGVASVSPMLGLLGTVWGMILAFQVASQQGLGKASGLATGIYEALVTTFAGLCVAIPALIFYYYFMGKIERILSEINDVSVEFLEHYLGARAT